MKSIAPQNNHDHSAGQQEALDIIKARIREIYNDESDSTPVDPRSTLMDRFWQKHKDHPDQQAAWQQFYEGLDDSERKSLWDEYHSVGEGTRQPRHIQAEKHVNDQSTQQPQPHRQATHHIRDKHEPSLEPQKKYDQFEVPAAQQQDLSQFSAEQAPSNVAHSQTFETPKPKRFKKKATTSKKLALISGLKSKPRLNHRRSKAHWAPLLISLTIGMLMLFAQYNPVVIALAKQYISPGDSLRSPIIIDPNASINVGPESKIIIPKINVDVPVVYDVTTKDEKQIQGALERGVVHYAGTGEPGGSGNNVIVGHSSNNFLNSGKYKFAFVLLNRMELNDTFILHHEGVRYVYKVTNIQTIEPNDFSLTLPTENPTVTLITCTPPGTSWRRLVIQGEQISPAPTPEQSSTQTTAEIPQDTPEIVPGNSPSLWNRVSDWLF